MPNRKGRVAPRVLMLAAESSALSPVVRRRRTRKPIDCQVSVGDAGVGIAPVKSARV
jgi:hypothetical protein